MRLTSSRRWHKSWLRSRRSDSFRHSRQMTKPSAQCNRAEGFRDAGQDKGGYQLVAGDLRQLPRLEVADVLPLLGNQDTGKADDVAAAILATAPTGTPGRIGRGTWALLRGDGCDRYPSRSEAEAALVTGCVNAGAIVRVHPGTVSVLPGRRQVRRACTARTQRGLSGICGARGRMPSSGRRRIPRKGASWRFRRCNGRSLHRGRVGRAAPTTWFFWRTRSRRFRRGSWNITSRSGSLPSGPASGASQRTKRTPDSGRLNCLTG